MEVADGVASTDEGPVRVRGAEMDDARPFVNPDDRVNMTGHDRLLARDERPPQGRLRPFGFRYGLENRIGRTTEEGVVVARPDRRMVPSFGASGLT